MDLVLKLLAPILSVILVICREISNLKRKHIDSKMRVTAEEIATVIEALYDGYPSSAKLDAFIKLCKKKHLNVKRAVEYLETKIIPISKNINSYIVEKKDNKDIGVTD